MREPKKSDSPSGYNRDVRLVMAGEGECIACHDPGRTVIARGMCRRCYNAAKRAARAASDQGQTVAPEGYAVGFTVAGGMTHAGRNGMALCGRSFDQAWDREIDRAHLPVTCGQCKKALRGTDLKALLAATATTDSGCREWMGGRMPKGYGVTQSPEGRVYAHRLAWELANDTKVPQGMVVMHECDNPPCIEPGHLKLGTIAENNADMVIKGRAAWQKVVA